MADVEDAMHLCLDLRKIVEIRTLPVDRMAGRCLEAAFSHRPLLPSALGAGRKARGRRATPPDPSACATDHASPSSAFWKRPACDFSALARVSNHSAISSKP